MNAYLVAVIMEWNKYLAELPSYKNFRNKIHLKYIFFNIFRPKVAIELKIIITI